MLDFDGPLWAMIFVGRLFLFVLIVLVSCLVEIAKSGSVFRVFLRHVRRKIGAIGGAAGFHFCDFFLGETGEFFRMSFRGDFGFLLGLFLFFEDSAAHESIGIGFSSGFFVLGFGEIGSQGGDLIVAQF